MIGRSLPNGPGQIDKKPTLKFSNQLNIQKQVICYLSDWTSTHTNESLLVKNEEVSS